MFRVAKLTKQTRYKISVTIDGYNQLNYVVLGIVHERKPTSSLTTYKESVGMRVNRGGKC